MAGPFGPSTFSVMIFVVCVTFIGAEVVVAGVVVWVKAPAPPAIGNNPVGC